MTVYPECVLAREAEISYATLAAVTDYDCWHEEECDVTVASVVETLKKNSIHMANIIKNFVPKINYKRTCECHNALEFALITPAEQIKKIGTPQVNNVLLKRFIK